MFKLLIECLMAFLLGSIPFGVLVCGSLGLNSPDTYGSKNIGASNVARQNLFAGFLTLLLDAAKGYLAIKICSSHYLVLLSVILGHCFTPFLNFNGGKGIATYGGGLIAVNPPLAATLGTVWFTCILQQTPAIASLLICSLSIIYAIMTKKFILLAINLLIVFRHKNNVQQLRQT